MAQTARKTVTVTNPQGLHARPAFLVAELAGKFDCRIELIKDGERIDGKSILSILTLGAAQGSQLEIEAIGPDASDALAAIHQLFLDGFSDPHSLDGVPH
jgi:phosphocarrier protein HPr